MTLFSTPLKYERLTDKWVLLLEDLHFSFTLNDVMGAHPRYLRDILSVTGLQADEVIVATAPKGFVTDLASVPKALRWKFKPDGPWAKAAVIHDIIYQSLKNKTTLPESPTPFQKLNAEHTQLLADRIFLCGMRAIGVSGVSRTLMYNAVRLFGHSSYGGNETKEDYGIFNPGPRVLQHFPYEIFRPYSCEGVPSYICEGESVHYDWSLVKYPNLKRAFLYPFKLPAEIR